MDCGSAFCLIFKGNCLIFKVETLSTSKIFGIYAYFKDVHPRAKTHLKWILLPSQKNSFFGQTLRPTSSARIRLWLLEIWLDWPLFFSAWLDFKLFSKLSIFLSFSSITFLMASLNMTWFSAFDRNFSLFLAPFTCCWYCSFSI